jgi:mercuric ion transport protein
MPDRRLLGIGLFGAAVSAVCCFTPILAALLTAIGLSAAIGWLDYVLLPALAVFIGIIVYALARRTRA